MRQIRWDLYNNCIFSDDMNKASRSATNHDTSYLLASRHRHAINRRGCQAGKTCLPESMLALLFPREQTRWPRTNMRKRACLVVVNQTRRERRFAVTIAASTTPPRQNAHVVDLVALTGGFRTNSSPNLPWLTTPDKSHGLFAGEKKEVSDGVCWWNN